MPSLDSWSVALFYSGKFTYWTGLKEIFIQKKKYWKMKTSVLLLLQKLIYHICLPTTSELYKFTTQKNSS